MRRRVVVSGYSTVDYVVRASGGFTGQGTTTMVADPGRLRPRAGGAPIYACAALARAGHAASPLTWLGDDERHGGYLDVCRAEGVLQDGVEILPGASTSTCLLIYHADGAYGCLIDTLAVAATGRQLALAAEADVLVFAAGDAEASAQLLAHAKPGALIAWIAKRDPECFPPPLTRRLMTQSTIVFCNEGERTWIDAIHGRRPGQVIFETRGERGVAIDSDAGPAFLPVHPLNAWDATGAGDTFAGAALGALLNGLSPAEAAQLGAQAARRLLEGRLVER